MGHVPPTMSPLFFFLVSGTMIEKINQHSLSGAEVDLELAMQLRLSLNVSSTYFVPTNTTVTGVSRYTYLRD